MKLFKFNSQMLFFFYLILFGSNLNTSLIYFLKISLQGIKNNNICNIFIYAQINQ